jgi:uncharacterized protein YciI
MRLLLLLVFALSLSAQDMRFYVMGMLYRGPQWTPEVTEETRKLQEGHMANINKLADEKKLILAGPMAGDGDLRGIFVFDTDDLKKAQEWCDQDPAVKAGRLRVELHKWYSARGIGILPAKR